MDQQDIESILKIGSQPFASEVVRLPWQPIVDVDTLHGEIKKKISQLLEGIYQAHSPQSLVITAPPGMGKSHLIAWTQNQIEKSFPNIAFVYVPPYRVEYGCFRQHLASSIFDSIFRHSNRLIKRTTDRVKEVLLQTYDEFIRTKEGRKELSAKRTLWQIVSDTFPIISNKSSKVQLKELKNALKSQVFCKKALERLAAKTVHHEEFPNEGKGRYDYDTFRAICFFLLEESCQGYIEEWLDGKPLPQETLELMGIRNSSWILRIKDWVWTLSNIVGCSIAFVFDELEDIYHSTQGYDEANANEAILRITSVLRELDRLPNICFLFCVQEVVWIKISETIDAHLFRRMSEGGICSIDDFSLRDAQKLVKERLNVYLWKKIKISPPQENPYYPLLEQQIKEVWENSNAVYIFLRKVRQKYESQLRHIRNGKSELLEENLDEKDLEKDDNTEREIPKRGNSLFSVPSPLYLYINRDKIKNFRIKKGFQQKYIGKKLKCHPSQISKLERGEKVSDDFCLKLINFYKKRIEEFLKESS